LNDNDFVNQGANIQCVVAYHVAISIAISIHHGILFFISLWSKKTATAKPIYNTIAFVEINDQTDAIKPFSKDSIQARNNQMIQTNTQTLNEIADFNPSGIASIIFLLNGTTVNRIQSNQDRNTIHSPCCRVNHNVPTTMRAKNQFISNPGANANGSLARSHIKSVASHEPIMVARVTDSILIPA
jgi:hypothetical protein